MLLDLVAIGIEGVMDQFAQVRLAEVVLLAARFNPREIQDVVDERTKALTLITNNAVVLLIFFLRIEAPHFQSFGVKPDQREWRPQLMRDVRNKIRFQPGQRHFFAYVAISQRNSAASTRDNAPRAKKLMRAKC